MIVNSKHAHQVYVDIGHVININIFKPANGIFAFKIYELSFYLRYIQYRQSLMFTLSHLQWL